MLDEDPYLSCRSGDEADCRLKRLLLMDDDAIGMIMISQPKCPGNNHLS